ncbi:MAG: DUF6036 family nucleotidyltransferase [Candidatus Omnitrophota bacterium]
MFNEDYKDILRFLLEEKVRFLVVGAYALGVHGYPRATGDIDIWVDADFKNSEKILNVLVRFGSPVKGISKDTFVNKGVVFQIGLPPRRIELITEIDGVTFAAAYKSKKIIHIQDLRVPFISLKDLIRNKKATGRPKDLLDVKQLEEKH